MFDECLVGLFLIEMSAEKWLVHRLAGSSMTRNLRPLRALKSPINLLQNQVKFLYSTFSSFHNLHHESSHLKDSTLYRLIWNRKSYFKQGKSKPENWIESAPHLRRTRRRLHRRARLLSSLVFPGRYSLERTPSTFSCMHRCMRARFFLVLFFSFSAVQFFPPMQKRGNELKLKVFFGCRMYQKRPNCCWCCSRTSFKLR